MAADLDETKQAAFYSNLLKDGRWVAPEDVVSFRQAISVITLADIVVGQFIESHLRQIGLETSDLEFAHD